MDFLYQLRGSTHNKSFAIDIAALLSLYSSAAPNIRIRKNMAQQDGLQVLPPGAGYGIVVGIGGIFALIMLGVTWMQNRFVSSPGINVITRPIH